MYDSLEHSTVCAAFNCIGEIMYMNFQDCVLGLCACERTNAAHMKTRMCAHADTHVCACACCATHMSACERGPHMRARERALLHERACTYSVVHTRAQACDASCIPGARAHTRTCMFEGHVRSHVRAHEQVHTHARSTCARTQCESAPT